MPPAAVAAGVAMTQDKWPRKCNIFTGWTFPDDLPTPGVTCTSTLLIFTSGEVANYVGEKIHVEQRTVTPCWWWHLLSSPPNFKKENVNHFIQNFRKRTGMQNDMVLVLLWPQRAFKNSPRWKSHLTQLRRFVTLIRVLFSLIAAGIWIAGEIKRWDSEPFANLSLCML